MKEEMERVEEKLRTECWVERVSKLSELLRFEEGSWSGEGVVEVLKTVVNEELRGVVDRYFRVVVRYKEDGVGDR